jgi:hypothetical protein
MDRKSPGLSNELVERVINFKVGRPAGVLTTQAFIPHVHRRYHGAGGVKESKDAVERVQKLEPHITQAFEVSGLAFGVYCGCLGKHNLTAQFFNGFGLPGYLLLDLMPECGKQPGGG